MQSAKQGMAQVIEGLHFVGAHNCEGFASLSGRVANWQHCLRCARTILELNRQIAQSELEGILCQKKWREWSDQNEVIRNSRPVIDSARV